MMSIMFSGDRRDSNRFGDDHSLNKNSIVNQNIQITSIFSNTGCSLFSLSILVVL